MGWLPESAVDAARDQAPGHGPDLLVELRGGDVVVVVGAAGLSVFPLELHGQGVSFKSDRVDL